MEIVKIQDLKKYFGTEPNIVKAVDGVTLSIEKGEFVAIIGTSGSGKTTLLNMIGALETPTSGSVIIDGEDVAQKEDEALTLFRREKIGFIFQQFNLVHVLNVRENITFPLDLAKKQVDETFFNSVTELLDIQDILTKMPNKISGGQQQRVAIARALITKPAIVLADEPTGNLDRKNSEKVIELLRHSNQSFDQTIVMITHDQNLAKRADRILRLEDGRIVGDEYVRH